MTTMLVTATSVFHGSALSQNFRVPVEPGRYFRRCKSPCDDEHDNNGIQIHCGCGYPCYRTHWTAPDGWRVSAEWSNSGRNNIVIEVDYDYAQ